MKRFFYIIPAVAVLFVGWLQLTGAFDSPAASTPDIEALANAIRDHNDGVQVTGEGTVTRILPDDTDGSRHQRFILTLATGQTLLVAHNVDVASRVTPLERVETGTTA